VPHVREEVARADLFVARVAARQHGVVSQPQLLAAGLTRSSIRRRVQAGRLHRVHRGVYAVGHRGLSRNGRWLAAMLAFGERAMLSHASAAALWGILSVPAVIHVTVAGTAGRARRSGIAVHSSTTLMRADITRRHRIPVTSPSRTLRDLRRVVPRRQFDTALRQAEVLGLPIAGELEPDRTRSELEARFLRLCRRHRLPLPHVNVRVGRFLVDFLWPAQRLIVELDGYRFHRGRAAFEADRGRDLELRRNGHEVVRLTWRQLEEDPAGVAAALREMLRHAP
jgi:very-short-patch-repair endonuclease